MNQLLVFAKEPRPGAVKTRLATTRGAEAACELYRAFLRDAAAMLARLDGVAVEWWVEGDPTGLEDILGGRWPVRKQPSGDLGQRLSFAFDAAFRGGGGPVAVIGTDCPLLTVDQLKALFARLAAPCDAAVLPAADGGYVALGLARPCPNAFGGIPWSTQGVCDATVEALQSAGRTVCLLDPLYDVDDEESLARLATDLTGASQLAPRTAQALRDLTAGPRHAFVRDALGREVSVEPSPVRVLSLVPSVTEFLFDAGLGDRVVGRTDYCISPPEVARLPSVGGPKSVDLERLVLLAPDLVLANAEENNRRQVEKIAACGIRVHVAFPRTLADVATLFRELGILLRAEAPLGSLARALQQIMRLPADLPRVRCACLIWKDPYMTASSDTLTSALLEAAGGENVFATASKFRYPAVSLDAIVAAEPRVILLPSEPYEFTAADARSLEASVPGATALHIRGEWVTWYGSRMEAAITGLREALAPFRQGL